jgi:septum formation protein
VQRIILASASPRRAELLRAAGIVFDVLPADVDETPRAGEMPGVYVRRLAEEKARAVAARARNYPVLAADTTVVSDGHILGKPIDDHDARRMLRMLAGTTHEVVTGVALEHSGQVQTHVDVTVVEFADMTDAEIDWYVGTGEPRDKAGAYAIQGHASRFITRIEGSYSNVVGLPVALVYQMLASAGVYIMP